MGRDGRNRCSRLEGALMSCLAIYSATYSEIYSENLLDPDRNLLRGRLEYHPRSRWVETLSVAFYLWDESRHRLLRRNYNERRWGLMGQFRHVPKI